MRAERDTNPRCHYCGQWWDIHEGPNQGVHEFVQPPRPIPPATPEASA